VSTFSERLREERLRLGLNQTEFAEAAGVQKRAQVNYEAGERLPDAGYLMAVADAGVDVAYVLTGQREPSAPALDAAERVLLDSYRRCSVDAKANLIQTAALLSAGMAPTKAKAASGGIQIGDMTNSAPGGVQVGHAGGKVSIKKGR